MVVGAANRRTMMEDIETLAPFLLTSRDKGRAPAGREVPEHGAAPEKMLFGKELALDDISFFYPGTQDKTLKHINLVLSKGSFVGICGMSGGGKSTLLPLLMGFL